MNEHQAKERAAGVEGQRAAKFPLFFAKSAFFGPRPSKDKVAKINNGTVTLADLGAGPIAFTCQHVIECYRQRCDEEGAIIFQIGNVELNPVEQLLAEDGKRDIATIRLTDEQVGHITSGGQIGSSLFCPNEWPSRLPRKGEFIAFGGFPGRLREVKSFDELEFGSWSSGASGISSVSETQFVSAFEREFWVRSFGVEEHLALSILGGLSGGPALMNRGDHWDLLGIVSQYHKDYDAMFFSLLSCVRPDGSIEPLPV